jgi:hypothetical protein
MEIPIGLCQCGCGERTKISLVNDAHSGYVAGQPRRFRPGHGMRGPDYWDRVNPTPNPSGLCMCGCGEKTQIAVQTTISKGWVQGQPRRFLPGHGMRVFRWSLDDTFWPRVNKTPDGCWLWTGRINGGGYGEITQKTVPGIKLTHRLSWVLAHGPIPKGLLVCHHCDVRACVRPDHLFLGSHHDNLMDASRKGRLKGRYNGRGPRQKPAPTLRAG